MHACEYKVSSANTTIKWQVKRLTRYILDFVCKRREATKEEEEEEKSFFFCCSFFEVFSLPLLLLVNVNERARAFNFKDCVIYIKLKVFSHEQVEEGE